PADDAGPMRQVPRLRSAPRCLFCYCRCQCYCSCPCHCPKGDCMSSSSPSQVAQLASPEISLEGSRDFCAKLTAAQARNFYYGMMLTPEPRRSAMYAIYAWMRAVDDLADAPLAHMTPETRQRQLEAFRRQTHHVVTD